MNIKVIYVDSDGLNQEHSEAADSVKFLSFQTANFELTDTKLGHLVDGNDAADEHIHDARYFRENEFISVSTGVTDAGKPIILDAGGMIDASMIDDSDIDHGSLGGLGDDDHLQYLRTDGTRALTGIQSYNSHPTFTLDTQIVDKKYVDDILNESEWFPYSALHFVTDNTAAPATEVLGDVYVLSTAGGAPHADYDGASAGDIVQFNGTVWVATTPTVGTRIGVDDEANVNFYLFGGATWTPKYEESTTASTGLTKVGFDIRISSSAAGAGLGFTTGVLNVNVDDSSIEIDTDTLRVKALGIKSTMIDFGTGAGQVKAGLIPLVDAGNYFPVDYVEDALQFLAKEIQENGGEYTSAGVTKGDLLFVSANDTAAKFGTISNNTHCIGLANATVAASGIVTALANGDILKAVLTGATAGTPYYWNGTGYSTSMPTTSGSNVWEVGVAKNATDLIVGVRQVKKNS